MGKKSDASSNLQGNIERRREGKQIRDADCVYIPGNGEKYARIFGLFQLVLSGVVEYM